MTKHARGGAQATPQAPRRRRSQEGGGEKIAIQAIAAPGLGCQLGALAPEKTRPSAAMARVDVGLPPPLLYAPAARRGWRIRARDCLSAAGASSSETPPAPSTAGCGFLGLWPQKPVADSRVAFFCLLFLARQEKKVPCRGHIPAPALKQGTKATIKKVAASAYQTSARAQKVSKYPGQPKRSRPASVRACAAAQSPRAASRPSWRNKSAPRAGRSRCHRRPTAEWRPRRSRA